MVTLLVYGQFKLPGTGSYVTSIVRGFASSLGSFSETTAFPSLSLELGRPGLKIDLGVLLALSRGECQKIVVSRVPDQALMMFRFFSMRLHAAVMPHFKLTRTIRTRH
jgi:hypothetical protein